jgi:hypothetical protein
VQPSETLETNDVGDGAAGGFNFNAVHLQSYVRFLTRNSTEPRIRGSRAE